MQNVFLGGGYLIMSRFKDLMLVFVKQESLEEPDRTSVDLAVCEDAVLQRIEDDPSTSTRVIAKDLNTSNANVWNVLHEFWHATIQDSKGTRLISG